MDINLLLTLLFLATGCMAAQRRQGERFYKRSRRRNNHVFRATGEGRRGKMRSAMLQAMLPYEAVENVPVKERMDVSLWQTRSHTKPKRRRSKRWIPDFPRDTHVAYKTEARNRTQGQPWPLPRNFRSDSNMVYQLDTNFRFVISPSSRSCVTLRKALRRYYVIITGRPPSTQSVVIRDQGEFEPSMEPGNPARLHNVVVSVLYSCSETYPEPTANETYTLQINNNSASITAGEVWGALRGLETLSRLVYLSDHRQPCVHMTDIVDFPRFHHRGVMINTGTHFLHPTTIKENLEVMEQNKLNVLHWRLVDDQSFPWVSKSYPGLRNKDSYKDVRRSGLCGYRRVCQTEGHPGHTASWGNGVPDVVVDCADDNLHRVLDVSSNVTYTVLEGLWDDLLTAFPGRYVHLGGDDVPMSCWAKSKDIVRFMERETIEDYREVQNYFTTRLSSIVNQLDSKRTLVFWQDVLDIEVSIDEQAIIQIWKPYPKAAMALAVSRGHRVIYSSPWSLNYVTSDMDWSKFYLADPLEHSVAATEGRWWLAGRPASQGNT
ncbi:beta-hexosaminidase subunit beta-like [Haliotis rubra]|uniref:beta-hexosaminidase subunit beta-like n=1 Tax=Haliotis rubra TaxID=36100 RepID=UPI001EE51774|nr:beta-hexosaminidase subunit beta-like [Haliotis rubra]